MMNWPSCAFAFATAGRRRRRADSLLDIFSGVLQMKAGEYLINLEGHYVAVQTALAQLLSTYLGRKKMAGKEEGR